MIFTLPQLIEGSADRFPEREAFRCHDRSLTYAQLVDRVHRLAGLLHEHGVGRRDRVGVYLHKSLESAVAIYGVMRAGGAYVPLDPGAPAARIAGIIRDCGIRHLITQDAKWEQARQLVAETELECLIGLSQTDEPAPVRVFSWEDVAAAPATPPAARITEQDLAYIMYTSGSTGAPKGIMHTHRSGLAVSTLAAQTYNLTHEDRLANHAPLHFDISTFDFFSGPYAGAATVIIPEAYMKLPASLSQLLADERITAIFTVPFALIQLLLHGALEARDLSALRWVLFGGEPFPTKHLRALMAALPQARFSNVYGPAEVNQCTYYHAPPIPEDSDEPIPIGRVWANAEGLIIDENDRPVAEGEVGELLIRSATMMQGYWARPDLNQRAFYLRRPFPDYDDVFYRTGDLVRRRPDGNLDFLGRKDRQIKTRGFRVELDEIEAALIAYEGVEKTAVYPIPDGQGSTLIEAAVILADETAVSAADLVNHLRYQLPWYAIPGHIEFMEQFPLTSSGKINRRALQQRAEARESDGN